MARLRDLLAESEVRQAKTPARTVSHQYGARFRRYLRALGPGLVTGAADDDPSCIGTLAQTGAAFGYSQLWMVPYAYPLMGVIQEICARIGLQTGRGLAANIRQCYPRPVLYLCLGLIFIANTITIGADLGAMAAAAKLLLDLPLVVWLVAIPLLSIGLQVFVNYKRYQTVLRVLTLSLLAYVVVAFTTPENWNKVLQSTLIPTITLNRGFFMNLVALFGSVISPYLYFWQMSQEVERKIEEGKTSEKIVDGVVQPVPVKGVSRGGVLRMRVDVMSGMVVAGLVAWSVIITMASTLNRQGIMTVGSAAEAAGALRPLAGSLSFVLFAAGIVGVGLLALPVLAGSVAYAVAETFDLRAGLSLRLLQAPGFYGVIIFSTLIGAAMNLIGINPMQALYDAAVINGLVAPVLLTMVMLIGGNRGVMEDKVNSPISNALGWLVTFVMAGCALALIGTLVGDLRSHPVAFIP